MEDVGRKQRALLRWAGLVERFKTEVERQKLGVMEESYQRIVYSQSLLKTTFSVQKMELESKLS